MMNCPKCNSKKITALVEYVTIIEHYQNDDGYWKEQPEPYTYSDAFWGEYSCDECKHNWHEDE